MPESSKSSHGPALRLELPCDMQAVRPAIEQCRQFLDQHGMDAETIIGCELALAEACNNAVDYASTEVREEPISLVVTWLEDVLEMQITDHALSFEWPSEITLPDASAEHGRGLYIIHELMDEVAYFKGATENCLRLRKRIPRHATPEGALASDLENGLAPSTHPNERNRISSQVNLERYLLAHELQIARNIQQSLLPQVLPLLQGFGLSGYCLSAREVGGDFYDILPLTNDNVLLVVADVMGKGVPAALFAATFRTLVRTMSELANRPAELLSRINRLMFNELSGVDMFITAQLALVQTHEPRLIIASAGHCPVLFANEQGDNRTISPEGMPLGILREAIYKEETVALHSGARVVFYTDGLIETRNPKGEFLGQAKLMEWLREAIGLGLNAQEIKDRFLTGLQQFQGPSLPTDDQTLLVLHQLATVACPATAPLPADAPLIQVP